jgi:hypothetical protein
MRREGMPKRVRCDTLWNGGFTDGVANLAGHGVIVEVVAGDLSGAWVGAERCGGEDVLPAPLSGGIGPFSLQGLRHVDVARADGEVLEVFFAEPVEVLLEALFEGSGQGWLGKRRGGETPPQRPGARRASHGWAW